MKKLLLIGLCLILGAGMQAAKKETQEQPKAPAMIEHPLKVRYTNWRNETAIRTIVPMEVYFGKTEYHPQEQWLLRVWDVERGAERIYAFKEIKEILE